MVPPSLKTAALVVLSVGLMVRPCAAADELPPGAMSRLGTPNTGPRTPDRTIQRISLSPDGSLLASTTLDGAVHLWALATQKERFTWKAEERWGCRAGVRFAPNGKVLAMDWTVLSSFTGDAKEFVTLLRDPATGKELRRVAGTWHAFSPDSKELITTTTKETSAIKERPRPAEVTLYCWDVESGRQLKVETTDTFKWGATAGATASHDGKLRAVFVGDPLGRTRGGELSLQTAEGKELHRFDAGPWPGFGPRFAPQFDPNDRVLMVRGYGILLYFWDTDSGKPLFEGMFVPSAKANDSSYLYLGLTAFAPNGRSMLVSCRKKDSLRDGMRLFETATGKVRWETLDQQVRLHAWTADAGTLAAAGLDGTVVLWDPSGMLAERARKAPTAAELEQLWKALAGDDAQAAYRAVGTMAAHPREALPFVKDQIPTILQTPPAVAKLIADLSDEKFDVRRKATAELEKRGPDIELALRQALAAKPTLEVQRRIEDLLAKCKGQPLGAEGLRLVRVVEALEMMATEPARAQLEKMDQQLPGSLLGRDCRAALTRLKR